MASVESLRFEQADSEDFVEITLADSDVSEPGADLLVFVRVRTNGFTAHLDTWIIRPAWEDFCNELSRLEKTRQGSASIASISPGELELLVQSTDRAGHMAVGGLVGTVIGCSKVSMTFSPVPFCPTTLPKLARTARAWLGTLAPPKASWNPPAKCGAWRGLSEDAKWAWLVGVRDHHFAEAERGRMPPSHMPPKRTGQTFVIDGEDIDDLPSFFCAMGEAVNGPGGYFGSQMMAFFDALHGGFGLDAPCTLRWRNSAKSRRVLDSAVFARELEREAKRQREHQDLIDPEVFLKRRAQAAAGTKTMFDEIVETVEVCSRDVRLILE